MNKLAMLFMVPGLLCLSNCDRDEIVEYGDTKVPVIVASGSENYLQYNSDYLFNQDSLFTFELIIPKKSLEELDADPAEEEYVEGQLVFKGDTLSPVGIRYKGSVGAFINCLTGINWLHPSGSKICTKLSMKVKVNWLDTDDTFYKLKKLQFHSMNKDASQMHERLGYWLFREMGVVAPRSVHARLVINGEFSGLYALTEQIDGRFTRYHFENGGGNLYKEIWPLDSDGKPHTQEKYLKHLETNEDKSPNANLIQTFAQEIDQSTEDTIQNVINKWMEVEQIIKYVVVDRCIRADDGPFHWYVDNGNCYNHNYFWYEDPIENKLYLIPWDLDNAFQNIRVHRNALTPIADDWGETRNNCQPFRYGRLNALQRSAACDKLTAAWASFAEEYEAFRDQFIQGSFSESMVISRLDTWAQQIEPAIIEASLLHDDAPTPEEWKEALDELKNDLAFARR